MLPALVLGACATSPETKEASSQYKMALETLARDVTAFERAWASEIDVLIDDLEEALAARAVAQRIRSLSAEYDGFSNAAWERAAARDGLIVLSQAVYDERERVRSYTSWLAANEPAEAVEPFGDDVANSIVDVIVLTRRARATIPTDLDNLAIVLSALRTAHKPVDDWIQTDVSIPGFDDKAIHDLGEAELEVLETVRSRIATNRSSIEGSLDDLADNVEFALRERQRLSSNIAKAQLLEAMKSPWTKTHFESTQKQVALYHLFALEEAEQQALAARVAARYARIDQLRAAYAQLLVSLSALITLQEQLLASFEHDASEQINLAVRQVISESQSFREAIDRSDDPRLQRLVDDLAVKEQLLAEASGNIIELLEALED